MSLTTSSPGDVMRRALLRIDDGLILGALDGLNFKATTKVSAKTTTAMVKTIEVSARLQPNCFSGGATNTLQA